MSFRRLLWLTQVMAGINSWSMILTALPLVIQSKLSGHVNFATRHPSFAVNAALSACCSAVGQLFIFMTISFFGPATFVLIMIFRMGLSLMASCLLFHHPLAPVGLVGVVLIFVALILRILWRRKRRSTPEERIPDERASDSSEAA